MAAPRGVARVARVPLALLALLPSLWALLSLVGALPLVDQDAARPYPQSPGRNHSRVIIIGAGAAGYAAAARLMESGFYDLTILEAENRYGGRINTVRFAENLVDLGAEWVHGEVGNVVYEMAEPLELLSHQNKDLSSNMVFVWSGGAAADQTEIEMLLNASDSIRNGENLSQLKNYTGSYGEWFLDQFNQRLLAMDRRPSAELVDRFLGWFEKATGFYDGSDTWFNTSARGLTHYKECPGNLALTWKRNGYRSVFDLLSRRYPNPAQELPVRERIRLGSEVSAIRWADRVYGPDGVPREVPEEVPQELPLEVPPVGREANQVTSYFDRPAVGEAFEPTELSEVVTLAEVDTVEPTEAAEVGTVEPTAGAGAETAMSTVEAEVETEASTAVDGAATVPPTAVAEVETVAPTGVDEVGTEAATTSEAATEAFELVTLGPIGSPEGPTEAPEMGSSEPTQTAESGVSDSTMTTTTMEPETTEPVVTEGSNDVDVNVDAAIVDSPVSLLARAARGARGSRAVFDAGNAGNAPIVVELSNGARYTADMVLVTVSLGVLKHSAGTLFDPPLDHRRMNAVRNLGFGQVDKLFMYFSDPWWPSSLSGYSVLVTEEDLDEFKRKYPQYGVRGHWVHGLSGFYIDQHKPNVVLMDWVVGEPARIMELYSDYQIMMGCKRWLEMFLGHNYSIPLPIGFTRSKWWSNPHFRGSYSYRSLDSDRANAWASHLAAPILDMQGKPAVMFAGEATHDHYYSTVHGAIETGWREADRILHTIKSENRFQTSFNQERNRLS